MGLEFELCVFKCGRLEILVEGWSLLGYCGRWVFRFLLFFFGIGVL